MYEEQQSNHKQALTGLLSNQGEKSISFYFVMVPLRKQVLKYGTPKPSLSPEQVAEKHIEQALPVFRSRPATSPKAKGTIPVL